VKTLALVIINTNIFYKSDRAIFYSFCISYVWDLSFDILLISRRGQWIKKNHYRAFAAPCCLLSVINKCVPMSATYSDLRQTFSYHGSYVCGSGTKDN
jgi:hypothetical protein